MIARKGLALLFGLAACVSLVVAAPGSGAPAPLVIAVEGPQSGAQASNGLDQLRGVRLAVKQLDAPGGLWDGRKVVVVAADDKADAADAKAVARRVIAKGIHFLIGPYNSSVGLANLPLYRRHDVLPLWMTLLDATAGFGATVQPMNTQISPIEARYVESLGAKHVAMLVDETATARSPKAWPYVCGPRSATAATGSPGRRSRRAKAAATTPSASPRRSQQSPISPM